MLKIKISVYWEIYYGNNWNGEFLSKLHYDIRGGLNEL